MVSKIATTTCCSLVFAAHRPYSLSRLLFCEQTLKCAGKCDRGRQLRASRSRSTKVCAVTAVCQWICLLTMPCGAGSRKAFKASTSFKQRDKCKGVCECGVTGAAKAWLVHWQCIPCDTTKPIVCTVMLELKMSSLVHRGPTQPAMPPAAARPTRLQQQCCEHFSSGRSKKDARQVVNRTADRAGVAVDDIVRRISYNQARTLAAAILSRENREQRERSRYAASWGKGMGTTGSDPLLGARPEDLGRAPTPLEEEIFKHAAEVSADPSVITAYFPPVARDHPSVHPSYSVNRDKKDKPVSWIYCMTVSVWHSCSRKAEIFAASTGLAWCRLGVYAVQNSEGIQVGTGHHLRAQAQPR